MKIISLILFLSFGAIAVFGFAASAWAMKLGMEHLGCIAETANGYSCPNSDIFNFASYHLSFFNKVVLALALFLSLSMLLGLRRVFIDRLEILFSARLPAYEVLNFFSPLSQLRNRIKLFTNSPNF